jgi:RNA polymerase sigma-70 factor (ECF subfamily)
MTDDRVSALYRQYGGFIYARCVKLLGDRVAAEDAMQETFIRVHRHLDKVPDSREALRWIYRVATNYCLNEIRDRKHRPLAHADAPEVVDASDSLADLLANRDLVERLVQRSPEKLRAPAWLHHVDGLDQAEVARVLGTSRRSVVNRLNEFAQNARKFVRRTAS